MPKGRGNAQAPDGRTQSRGGLRQKGTTHMAELKTKGVCDFCGDACNTDMQGAKAYDCEDFPMAVTGAMSHGAWGACPSCAALVDGEKWDDLEKRMTAMQRRRFGFLAEPMLPMLRLMHAQQVQLFRQHRIVAEANEARITK
jgi:hypothetical protein